MSHNNNISIYFRFASRCRSVICKTVPIKNLNLAIYQKSKMSGDSSEKVSENFKLTPDFSPKDYEKNWSDQLMDIEDSDERNKVLDTFYKHIWNLLFGPKATKETQAKAIALLVVERPDAAFLNPFAYNDWIRTVKQEIIKREMSDLWHNEFKTKQLGLIWARDSDYYDDMDDPEPAQFYKLKESDPDIQWSD